MISSIDVTLVTRRRIGAEIRQGADLQVSLEIVPQVFVILDADGLVAPARLKEGVEALGPLKLVQYERVRAQVGDVFLNVEVHAVDHGHDHDQRGGGDHHAQ